jgi:hypothetical protein
MELNLSICLSQAVEEAGLDFGTYDKITNN